MCGERAESSQSFSLRSTWLMHGVLRVHSSRNILMPLMNTYFVKASWLGQFRRAELKHTQAHNRSTILLRVLTDLGLCLCLSNNLEPAQRMEVRVCLCAFLWRLDVIRLSVRECFWRKSQCSPATDLLTWTNSATWVLPAVGFVAANTWPCAERHKLYQFIFQCRCFERLLTFVPVMWRLFR